MQTNSLPSTAALGDIVAIEVGPEKKQYQVHKDILCHYSEYFPAAFNGSWKESEDKTTPLLDVEEQTCAFLSC